MALPLPPDAMALPLPPDAMALPPVERAPPLVQRLNIAITEHYEAIKARVKCDFMVMPWEKRKHIVFAADQRCHTALGELNELMAELRSQEHITLLELEDAEAFLWTVERLGDRGSLRVVRISGNDLAVRLQIWSLLMQHGFTGIVAEVPSFFQLPVEPKPEV